MNKYAKQVGAMVLPWSPVINGARYLSSNLAPSPRAVLPAGTFASSNRKVVVLIIGESARAQNFLYTGTGGKPTPHVPCWRIGHPKRQLMRYLHHRFPSVS
jgi:lipid A ethanolaminephosphotransferase